MSFTTPSFDELVAQAQADFAASLPGADAQLRYSLLNVLANMHATATVGLHAHLNWMSRQILPDTADSEYLERLATGYGLSRIAATFAKGEIIVTGKNRKTVPAGTPLSNGDWEYTTDVAKTVKSGAATIPITATGAGPGHNAAGAVELSFISPVKGIDNNAVVSAAGLTGGADTEDDARLRARLLHWRREPPHGGAAHDYIQIQRPVTAKVSVKAPVAVPLKVVFTSLSANTQVVHDAILQELQDFLKREAEPGGTILLSRINEAISLAAGEFDHQISQPPANVTHAVGEIATISSEDITWP